MSFGLSLGDFVTIPTLAWQVYKSCKDSSDDFKSVADDVVALHIVLREVEEHLKEQPISSPRQAHLAALTRTCQAVLNDLEKLLEKYDSLGSQSQRTWDRMRWGLEDIDQLRGRLSTSTAMLTAFNTSLISSSQARVEKKLNQLLREIREGKREGSFISIESIESLTTEDKEAWKHMRRELEDFGISTSSFLQHRNFIVTWFREAVAEGDFHSDAIDQLEGSTVHGSELTLDHPKLRTRTHTADWIQHRRLSNSDLDDCSTSVTKDGDSGADLPYFGSPGWNGSKLESGVAIETNRPQLSHTRTTEDFIVHRESIKRASESYPNLPRASDHPPANVQPALGPAMRSELPTIDVHSETAGTDANRGTRRSFVDAARNSLGKAKRTSKDKTARRSWKALFSSPGNNGLVETGDITDGAVETRHANESGSDLLREMPGDGHQEKEILPFEENSLYHEHLYSICQEPSVTPATVSKARRRVTHDSSQKLIDFQTSSPASRMSFFTRPSSFPARSPAKKPVEPPSPAVEDAYARNEAIISQLSQRIDEARRDYARQVLKTGRKPVVDVSSATRTPVQPVYTDKANRLHLNLLKQVKGTRQDAAGSSVTLEPFSAPFSQEEVDSPPAGPDSKEFEKFKLVDITPHPTRSHLAPKSSESSLTSGIPPEPDCVFGSSTPSWLFPTPPTREGFHPQHGGSGNQKTPLPGKSIDSEQQRQTLVYI